ncbi:hypothetical protein [Streptomyces sp. NPDC002232]|uniref:hypothetical protein n=1 Tax=Streptomyces sp. NPDC002232 TaxID=3364640 RepID=UPI0036B3CC57
MSGMDLSGIAAVVALAGIPVTLLIGRWQKQTALRQAELTHRAALEAAEANHRTALATAEANHRTALATAEASHRTALEVARHQSEVEEKRWTTEARSVTYKLFNIALAEFRAAFTGDDEQLASKTFQELHNAEHLVRQVGPRMVFGSARRIVEQCGALRLRFPATSGAEREALWKEQVSYLRDRLDLTIADTFRAEGWSVGPQ